MLLPELAEDVEYMLEAAEARKGLSRYHPIRICCLQYIIPCT